MLYILFKHFRSSSLNLNVATAVEHFWGGRDKYAECMIYGCLKKQREETIES